jgi:hypothetical protein
MLCNKKFQLKLTKHTFLWPLASILQTCAVNMFTSCKFIYKNIIDFSSWKVLMSYSSQAKLLLAI